MRNPQQINLYSYVGNNPLKYIDPNGEDGEIVTEEREYTFTATQEKRIRGKTVITQIQFKVTEKIVDVYNDKLEVVESGAIRVSVTATNGEATTGGPLSQERLDTAAKVAATVIAKSHELGVDKSITLSIAAKETFFGTVPRANALNFQRSDINPMQLTSNQFTDGTQPTTNLDDNVRNSIRLLKEQKMPGRTLEGAFRAYGPPPSQDPNYVSDSVKYNTEIKQGIQKTQKVSQPFVVNFP
jgi:hypothetical protein